jgi:hypothetical protein
MVPDLVSFKLLIFFVAASHATSPLAAGFSTILVSFSSAPVPYYIFILSSDKVRMVLDK